MCADCKRAGFVMNESLIHVVIVHDSMSRWVCPVLSCPVMSCLVSSRLVSSRLISRKRRVDQSRAQTNEGDREYDDRILPGSVETRPDAAVVLLYRLQNTSGARRV